MAKPRPHDPGQVRRDVVVDHPRPGVRRLTIDNPARRGALSAEVLAGLVGALEAVPGSVRCLLLTGSGTTFCAGYDLKELAVPVDPEEADAAIAPDHVELFERLEDQPLPVIAALNGPVLGGGIELALACDVRIAVPAAELAAPAARLGLPYSPGGLERLLDELPFAVAADLFLTGGSISARRAHELGLVAMIVEPEELTEVALGIAARVAELAPLAVRANRRALRLLRHSRAAFGEEARSAVGEGRADGMRSADFAEGVAAFRERRPPRFRGS